MVQSTWHRIAPLAGILILGTVTFCVGFWLHLADEKERLANKSDQATALVLEQLSSAQVVLTGLVGAYHASNELTADEFSAYSNEIVSSYGHIQLVFKAIRVPERERAKFIGRKRIDGYPFFDILGRSPTGELKPISTRDEYLPIDIVQPGEPTYGRLYGYDLLSDPILSREAQEAIDTGNVTMSTPMDFVHGGRGIIALKAIYLGHEQPQNTADRRNQIQGLIGVTIPTAKLLSNFSNPVSNADGWSYKLYVLGDLEKKHLLFDNKGEIGGGGLLGPITGMKHERTIQLGDKRYELVLSGDAKMPIDQLLLNLLASAIAMFLGVAVLGAVRKIRESSQLVQETSDLLKENEDRFRDYAEIASDWFWAMDEDFRFTFFSKSSEEAIGISPKQLLGFRLGEIMEFRVDERARAKMRTLLKRQAPFRDAYYNVRVSKKEKWYALNGVPIYDTTGKFAGFRGTGRDVTQQIAFQNELRNARDQAELANRAKSDFLANISHELRTPLNAIIGMSEAIANEYVGTVENPECKEFAKDINSSGHHLLSIINDLLDVSKIESGKHQLNEKPLSVRAVFSSCERMIADRMSQKGLKLETRIADNLPELMGDERAIKQVIINLLSNAIKFTSEGGKISVNADLNRNGKMEIRISDNGIGIPRKDLEKVFRPFEQVDTSLSRTAEGTGLGLPLSRALVELHSGRLTIDSAVGEGTTVTIEFPAGRLLVSKDRRDTSKQDTSKQDTSRKAV